MRRVFVPVFTFTIEVEAYYANASREFPSSLRLRNSLCLIQVDALTVGRGPGAIHLGLKRDGAPDGG